MIVIFYFEQHTDELLNPRMRKLYQKAKQITEGHWAPSKTIVLTNDGRGVEFNLEGVVADGKDLCKVLE
jgi:hypothetical protein